MDIFLAEITNVLPSFGALAVLLGRKLKHSRFTLLQLFFSSASTWQSVRRRSGFDRRALGHSQ
jgi:hypothetical protein